MARDKAFENARSIALGEDILTPPPPPPPTPSLGEAFDVLKAIKAASAKQERTAKETIRLWNDSKRHCKPILAKSLSDITKDDVNDHPPPHLDPQKSRRQPGAESPQPDFNMGYRPGVPHHQPSEQAERYPFPRQTAACWKTIQQLTTRNWASSSPRSGTPIIGGPPNTVYCLSPSLRTAGVRPERLSGAMWTGKKKF